MESLWNKYNKIKEVFYRDFVYDSSYTEQASCIPLSSVKNGVGWVGDGTINLAQYLQLVYTEMILGYKTKDDVRNAILVLTRLADTTYDLFFNSNKGIYFKFEKGFEEAGQVGYDIFEYVIRNRHKIYNPYYSALLHHWTFLPDMDTDKVKPWDRVSNRNKNLKYKVKVKRGANNWYFSGGFRWAFKKFGGECSTFWHCLWYKPFIFLADRVYHPYVCKWFGIKVKNNSYYCLGSTNEKSWYGPGFNKRLVKFFNKSLEGSELFMPHLVFSQEAECVEGDKLRAYLDKWEWDGVNSPIEFLILCNWYKIKFGK